MDRLQLMETYANMTDDMLDCLHDADELEKEVRFAFAKWQQAKTACEISLPATAADGKTSVIHGSRMHIRRISEYWKHRYITALRELPLPKERELQSELEKWD